jgi:glycosyltransferase involved in cell wall biosynthesis
MGFPPNDPRLATQDVIFVQRINHEFFLEWIPAMQQAGKKIVLDMDDNIWEIPSGNLAHRYYPKEITRRMTEIVKLVDAVTTSTIPLGEYISKWNPNVVVVPNMIHSTYAYKEMINNEKLRIGWAGSYTHAFEFPAELIKYLRDRTINKKDVEIIFSGFAPNYVKGFVHEVHGWVDADNWLEFLFNLNLDIGFAVVENNMFNKCKSNLKFLEYSGCSVPTIARSQYPYDNSIDHNETGLIVTHDKRGWNEAFDQLINDKSERDRLRKNAWQFVHDNFTYENNGSMIIERYIELFDHLFKGKDISSPLTERYKTNGLSLK